MHQQYISNPQVNDGEPLPVYEMGKVEPGSPLWEMAQSMPTLWEVIQQQQKENSSNLTAATAVR